MKKRREKDFEKLPIVEDIPTDHVLSDVDKYGLHFPIGKYKVKPWYYTFSARTVYLQDHIKSVLADRRLKWTEEMQDIFNRMEVMLEMIHNEKVEALVRQRVEFIESRLNSYFEDHPWKGIQKICITCPALISVLFSDNSKISIEMDTIRFRRIRFKRTTKESLDKTIALSEK